MREIPLTQGKIALVDDEDYAWLSPWKWFAHRVGNTFYAQRRTQLPDGRWVTIPMHRELLGLQRGDKRQGDHINHNGLDNRRANLRIVTRQENQWNRFGTKGYAWHKKSRKFQALICVGRKRICLGYYTTAEAARAAYVEAKSLYHQIGGLK